jgi:hypothetical protein
MPIKGIHKGVCLIRCTPTAILRGGRCESRPFLWCWTGQTHLRPLLGKADGRTSDTSDLPKISLLSLDLEQRKSPAGIPPCRAPQVVQARTESGGSPAKAPRLEGWSEAATLCNLAWVSTQSVVHWWCKFGANAEQKSPTPCSLRGRQDVTKSLFD